jgi:hypothetical protein
VAAPVVLPHLFQKSLVFVVLCCRQGLSTKQMLSSISQWTNKCTFHGWCDGWTNLLLKKTAGAPALVLYLHFSASASIFPVALRSRCTVQHQLCWDEGPTTNLTCSHLLSTCTVPCFPSAVEDPKLHCSISPQHPFMHHYIPYICNLSATRILEWAT